MSNVNTHYPLILASGSIARRALMDMAQLEYDVIPADIDESEIKERLAHETPAEIAKSLAVAKASVISNLHPEAYVIGGDQVCAFGKDIFDKPGSAENVVKHLQLLSGKTHIQYSGVAVVKAGKLLWATVDEAQLTMRTLTNEEIHAYVKLDDPIGACGAYKFESLGCHLFAKVEGSSHTIQGMPLLPLLNALSELGVYSLS